jgi:outer membrane protein OmpA-like peptidoglycan-associated protein
MRKILLLLFVFSLILNVNAQNFLGNKEGNYSGVLGNDLNPANIADNRYKVDMLMFGGSLDIYNSYIGLNESFFSLPRILSDSTFFERYTTLNTNNKFNSFYLGNQVNIASAMINVDPKVGIGLNLKMRNYVNVDGLEPELSRLMVEGLDYGNLWNTQLSNKRVSIQAMSWVEYGVTYGRVVMDEGEHFLKIGGQVKLLQGLAAMYMFIDNFNYSVRNTDTISVFQSDVRYGHSTNFTSDENGIKYKFTSQPGVGLDIGAVYEWRPNHNDYRYSIDNKVNELRPDVNKYKLKAGFSVLDIGRIKYRKGPSSGDFNADVQDWDVNALKFNYLNDFSDTLKNRFNRLPSDERTFNMNLPTTVSFQLDYNVYKKIYVNHTSFLAFQFNNNPNKVHNISNFSITPRFEDKIFGAAFPVSYSPMTGLRYGVGLRIGPLIFGSTSLGSLMSQKNVKGTDLYVGIRISALHKIPKDRDGDGVSDKFDLCPDVKGVWAFKGCPDTDGDGIPDSEDECPAEFGLIEFGGCPDTDGDGIPDKDDECPTIPGPKEFNGCPDTDGDGIPDKIDKCPTIKGLAEFDGCPDTDGDGIPDSEDNCPTEAGPKENFGCPITTKLHLVDIYGDIVASAILNDNGEFQFENLPANRSYLFLMETEDPNMPGEVYVNLIYEGKTVRINAKLNEVTGYFEYRHLKTEAEITIKPQEIEEVEIVLLEEEKLILKRAFDNLEFNTGKAIISQSSYNSLEELAELLKKKPEWKIKIEGHTDNVGKAANNLILSKRRAEAVRLFLVNSGVNEDRVIVKYYGQSKPIADNSTEEGRQTNRRVEMHIIE